MAENYKTKLKKGDRVIVNVGHEKGKSGAILRIDLKKGRVFVEGVNFVKKAMRKKNQNDRAGIIEIEGSLHLSNVQLLTKNGEATRIRYKLEKEEEQSGKEQRRKKQRISTKTGEVI